MGSSTSALPPPLMSSCRLPGFNKTLQRGILIFIGIIFFLNFFDSGVFTSNFPLSALFVSESRFAPRSIDELDGNNEKISKISNSIDPFPQNIANASRPLDKQIPPREEQKLQQFVSESRFAPTSIDELVGNNQNISKISNSIDHFLQNIANTTGPLDKKIPQLEGQKLQQLKKRINQEPSEVHTAVAPWRSSPKVPLWMKHYFQWHQQARAYINKTGQWWKYRYLVQRCLSTDNKMCGGTADRLRSLPYLLMVANRTKRLLFLFWEHPCALEEFLLPPAVDGLNWTWPPFPDADLHNLVYGPAHRNPNCLNYVQNQSQKIVVSVVERLYGNFLYDAARSNRQRETNFLGVYSDVWHSFFVPSKPVQQLIDEEMQQKGLNIKGLDYHRFDSMHIRSKYTNSTSLTADEDLTKIASNALNCLQKIVLEHQRKQARHQDSGKKNSKQARRQDSGKKNSNLLGLRANDTTVFVFSDSNRAKRAVAKIAKQRGIVRVVSTGGLFSVDNDKSSTTNKGDGDDGNKTAEEESGPLHLNRGSAYLQKDPNIVKKNQFEPARYYDSFVDLYIMSQARCLVTGRGVSATDLDLQFYFVLLKADAVGRHKSLIMQGLFILPLILFSFRWFFLLLFHCLFLIFCVTQFLWCCGGPSPNCSITDTSMFPHSRTCF